MKRISFIPIRLIAGACLIIIIAYSCGNGDNKNTATGKDTIKSDTIKHEPVTPALTKLKQLNKELEFTVSLITIKDMEIKNRIGYAKSAAYAATLPGLDSTDKEIANEKLEAAKKVLDQSYADKKELQIKLTRLAKQIDSLKNQ